MADPYPAEPAAFPDSHTTTTHTTSTYQTTSTSMQCTFDKAYALSLPGILRVVEMVVGFLYWVVIASYYLSFSGKGWIIFVGVTAWVFTVILYVLFVTALTQRVTVINWVLTELINNAAWCVLHFIAAVLLSVRSGQLSGYPFEEHGKLVFGCICGWGLFVLYGVHTFLNFRQFMAMGGLASLRDGGGATAATTTTVTTTTTMTAATGEGEKSQEPPSYPGGPFT